MKSSLIAQTIQKPERLEYFLDCPLTKLMDIIDHIDRYYYEKKELKLHPDGTPKMKNGIEQYRILYPSIGYLKTIQNSIKKRVLQKIPLPPNIKGGVKKNDNVRNAKCHQGKKFHFCTDLLRFYPSVSHTMVYQMFIQQGFPRNVSSSLTKLTTYNGELPQGTPTSTHIANLVSLPLDLQLIEFCTVRGITYTRYVDDLSFSSKQDFKDETNQIVKLIRANRFKINHDKTFYKVGRTLITGIWVKNNGLSAREDQKQRLLDPQLTMNQVEGLRNYVDRVKNI